MNTITNKTDHVRNAALGYLLNALAIHQSHSRAPGWGPPDSTIAVEARGAVISVTTAPAPLFRDAVQRLAADLKYDVVLLRLGSIEADFVEVSIDLTLGLLTCRAWSMNDLALWAGRDGALWLAPPTFGPAVSVSADGFSLELVPPYETLAERSSGIVRAAADLTGLLRPTMTEVR